MKICHLIKTTRGAVWALREVEELIKLGCNIHVILPDMNDLAQVYIDKGATVHILNIDVAYLLKKPWKFFRNLVTFRQLLKSIQPDIVHSHFVGTTLFMRIAMLGIDIKRVFQVPGPLHLEKFITRFLEISLSNKNDYWIATCNLTRRIYLEQGIKSNKVVTIFYGTDVSKFNCELTGTLREEFNIPNDTKIVGMVAYAYAPKKWLMHKRGIKGHEDLIDAMEIVLSKRQDVLCVIVGGAWTGAEKYYDSLKKEGEMRLGKNILFLGNRSDVPYLYPDFDVVVHPSHSENLGGAAESLLMQIPTVATKVGGFPDIVIPDITGWLVDKGDPVELAHTILQVLQDLSRAKQMSIEGRNRLLEDLKVENTSKQVYEFYKFILV